MVKAITEKMGTFDREGLAAALHGTTITTAQEPCILIDTTWDAAGEMDRQSFMIEIKGGKQLVTQTLPPLRAV